MTELRELWPWRRRPAYMRGICKMINKVGREIPEEILKATGKKVFEGAYAYDNYEYTKAAPTVRALSDPKRSKMVSSIREALEKVRNPRQYDSFLPPSFPRGRLCGKYGDGRGSQYGNQGHHRLRQLVRKGKRRIVLTLKTEPSQESSPLA